MKLFTQLLCIALLACGTLGIVGCGEPDPRAEELKNDIVYMKRNVDEADTLTYGIKSILNLASMDGFDVDNFEYFTEIKDNKALILVRIPEIKDVAKSDKGIFLDLIDGMTNSGAWEGKEKYIAIFSKLGVNMSLTPNGRTERLATKADLYDYYGPKPVTE